MYLYSISFLMIGEDGRILGAGVHQAKLERKLSVALYPILQQEILDSAKKDWSEKSRNRMTRGGCPIELIAILNIFEDPSNPDR